MASGDKVRIAAVADLHCTRRSQGVLRPVFAQMAQHAEIIALCGDLTDYGLPEEAGILVNELEAAKHSPIVAVLGNHDFESGKQGEVHRILTDGGVTVLDGDSCEIRGVGFAGVKGFCGGFDRYCLEPWGEGILKHFVREAIDEALKLEGALARLDCERRVALLHYSPIRGTVDGEHPEIVAFLGTRRLEDPLNRFPVDAIFHGHAHFGSAEGMTSAGTPVFNVAMPLLRRKFPDAPPFRVVEIPVPLGMRPTPVPEPVLVNV